MSCRIAAASASTDFAEQGIPFDEVRIRAQKTDIGERVAQECVVGLEALGQLLQCPGRADEAVNRRTIEPLLQGFRAQLRDRRVDLRHGSVERIVVLGQPRPSLQDIAM